MADTGSTDGTVETLRAAGVTVHPIAIRPWRFDDARNAALALIPADVDVCCSMDMDRVLTPGWRETLEAVWRPETTAMMNQIHYRRSVDDPQIMRSFPVKLIHARWGYHFRRPVHEALYYSGDEVVHGTGDIVMGEVQDLTKDTRRQYMPLMELAHREDPSDEGRSPSGWGREYMYADKASPRRRSCSKRYLDAAGQSMGRGAFRGDALPGAGAAPNRKMHWLDRARRRGARIGVRSSARAGRGILTPTKTGWACSGPPRTGSRRPASPTAISTATASRPGGRTISARSPPGGLDAMEPCAVEWAPAPSSLNPGNDRLKTNLEFYKGRREQLRAGE